MNKRNLIIAGVLAVAAIAGIQYKAHVDYWSYYESCQDARQIRRDASRLLGGTISNGMADLTGEVTALLQDANDLIANCNAKGI